MRIPIPILFFKISLPWGENLNWSVWDIGAEFKNKKFVKFVLLEKDI